MNAIPKIGGRRVREKKEIEKAETGNGNVPKHAQYERKRHANYVEGNEKGRNVTGGKIPDAKRKIGPRYCQKNNQKEELARYWLLWESSKEKKSAPGRVSALKREGADNRCYQGGSTSQRN